MNWIGKFQSHANKSLHFQVMLPDSSLSAYVRYYWVLCSPAKALCVEEFLAPDGFEEIIFSYDGAYQRQTVNTSESESLGNSYIVGCKPHGVTCAGTDSLFMVGVKLAPQSLYHVVGEPLSNFSHRTVPIDLLNKPFLSELEAKIFDAKNTDTIKAVLDQTLKHKLFSQKYHALTWFASSKIFATQGQISIDEISDATGCHYRTLEKAFKKYIGISPKVLARTLRFKNAFHCMDTENKRCFNFYDFGYYDQSHFIKEFKHFTGKSPGKFFHQEKKYSTDVYDFCLDVDINHVDSAL